MTKLLLSTALRNMHAYYSEIKNSTIQKLCCQVDGSLSLREQHRQLKKLQEKVYSTELKQEVLTELESKTHAQIEDWKTKQKPVSLKSKVRLSVTEKSLITSQARMIKTISKVALFTSKLLGILAILALGISASGITLNALPLSISVGILQSIGMANIGVSGLCLLTTQAGLSSAMSSGVAAFSLYVHKLLHNCSTIRQKRALHSTNFQYFVYNRVYSSHCPRFLRANLHEALTDAKLHDIYAEWKHSLKKFHQSQ